MLSTFKNSQWLPLQLIDYLNFDFSLGKSFRQESKFFAGTFNALPLLANLDDKAFTAAEVRYERTADLQSK